MAFLWLTSLLYCIKEHELTRLELQLHQVLLQNKNFVTFYLNKSLIKLPCFADF